MQPEKMILTANNFIHFLKHGGTQDFDGLNYFFHPGEIRDVIVNEAIRLDKSTFNTDVGIYRCNLKDLAFSNCIFNKSLIIEETHIDQELWIHGCKVNEDVSIGFAEDGIPSITKSYSIGEIDINFTSINTELIISNVICKKGMTLESLTVQSFISVLNCIISETLFISEISSSKELTIWDCTADSIKIDSIPDKRSVLIANTSFVKLRFEEFTNLGYLQWNKIKPNTNSIIEIQNAIMGKWDIVNCDFSNTKMVLYSSKITDAFYTNTKFPLILGIPENITEQFKVNDILRDGYNQLKTIAQKQNDRKTYLHFQAAELRSFYKTLHWWYNFRTKFQLGSMRISNNYGTSWGLGFLFVIIANAIFVSAAYWDRNPLRNWEGVGNYFSGYLSSIFSLISVPTYFKGSWEVNWFYFSRLFIAFGIYQTIAAFRKFGKTE